MSSVYGEKMLEVKDLFAGYGGSDIIYNISFKAERGESLCILGPNGSGKTTLLKAIARIINYRGFVLLEGRDAASFPRKELAKKIAMLSQNAQIYFPFTVYETVSLGRFAWSQGFLKNLSAEDETIIEEVLKMLDLWNIKEQMIDELSGGTLQRVFLARTLAQKPDLILLDEPANHLDLKHQIDLLLFLKSWAKENNKTLIGVFHDLNMAQRFSDTAVVLNYGTIAGSGKTQEILKSDLLNAVYDIDIRAFMRESFAFFNN
jgi:iron complex transport system ATP-binding protein